VKAKERLAEIRARAEKATSGPWGKYGIEAAAMWESVPGQCIGSPANTEYIARVSGYALPLHANVDFITHSREDIPWLLDRIAELERLVPDAIVLRYMTSHMDLDQQAGWGVPIECDKLVTAIRKYREVQAAALRGEEK